MHQERLEVLYCDLVEYCLVGADEAPLDHLLLAVRVEDRVADVEELAVIRHVRVVAVHPALLTFMFDYSSQNKIRYQR